MPYITRQIQKKRKMYYLFIFLLLFIIIAIVMGMYRNYFFYHLCEYRLFYNPTKALKFFGNLNTNIAYIRLGPGLS